MKITFPTLVPLWKQPKSRLWLAGILCIAISLCVGEPWKTSWNILGLFICVISMFFQVMYESKISGEGQELSLADLRTKRRDLKVMCADCNSDLILLSKSCNGTHMRVTTDDGDEEYQRMPYTRAASCPDCGVKTGGFHHQGCSQELCMHCNSTLNSCPCEGQAFTP